MLAQLKHWLTHAKNASALTLGIYTVLGIGLLALTAAAIQAMIAANARNALLSQVNALIPADRYDNAPLDDRVDVRDPQALGTGDPVPFYRAFKNGQPVAVIATPVAPNGYGGPITLMVAVHADGTLAGVRVLAHQETPGYADFIDDAQSAWIVAFKGKSLGNPEARRWTVKKDGGAFDQATGATVTPYAIVTAVRKFLVYFQDHRDELLAQAQLARR